MHWSKFQSYRSVASSSKNPKGCRKRTSVGLCPIRKEVPSVQTRVRRRDLVQVYVIQHARCIGASSSPTGVSRHLQKIQKVVENVQVLACVQSGKRCRRCKPESAVEIWYRYMLFSMPDALEQVPVLPECRVIFKKSKRLSKTYKCWLVSNQERGAVGANPSPP